MSESQPKVTSQSNVTSQPDVYSLERVLRRRGFASIAGVDEAGRGACAGPLVAAAVILPGKASSRDRILGLTDSKLLTSARREQLFEEVTRRALSYSTVVVPAPELDEVGLHRSNIAALRRAVARLSTSVDYVLTDGFKVAGLPAPGLGVWKGDQVAACVAAASIVAKVTRDRLMQGVHELFPMYEFSRHKGYITPAHTAALRQYGPCEQHRLRYANVAAVIAERVAP